MRNLLSRPATAVAAMFATVIVGGLMPLVREPRFYFWDDTQAVGVGVWQEIPSQLLAGNIPFLQIDMWRGGNFAAEAATGVWNPVLVALMTAAKPIDDLAWAITLCKIALMLICAGGVYLLARNYGAAVWPSAIVGAALPLSGWQLFVDGTAWINGTTMTAFAPWAWWALRRAAQRGFTPGSIVVAVVAGYLLISTGNPFTAPIIVVIYLAVLVEMLGERRWKLIGWLVLVGVATMLTILVVYLPFVGTSSVGVRAESRVFNDEFLTANLNHFAAMSTSSYLPWLNGFGGAMKVPAAYLAWFVVPLLPWLRLRQLKRWRFAGLALFAVGFLAFTIGPSELWLFRWPARMIPFVYLPVIVAFAVALSAGLRRDRPIHRLMASGALILFAAWIAAADDPGVWKWHALTMVLTAGLVVVAVLARQDGRLFLVTSLGGLLLLGTQLIVTPTFSNHADYGMPSSRQEMKENFEGRYVGNTLQIMSRHRGEPWVPTQAWQDFSLGNMYAVADVASTTAYSGIGFTKHDEALCGTFNGQMCVDAWEALFSPRAGEPLLADQMRLETVVVERDKAEFDAPAGWEEAEVTDWARVYRRVEPLPYPGTIGAAGDALDIISSERDGETSESTEFTASGDDDRTITYARLAWPGYRAEIDGRELDVNTSSTGLLEITVPDDLDSGAIDLSFTPPGLQLGLVSLAAGVLLTGGMAVVASRRARGGRAEHAGTVDPDDGGAHRGDR